jgi:hypothetical protein
MKRYADESGMSGISAYETGKDWIKIKFKSGQVYKYSYDSAGNKRIEAMKKLAEQGKGLATYINKYVRDQYE